MKTLIIIATILGSSLINNSYGKGTVNLNEKLKEVITFEKGTLAVEKNQTEFVKISFKINEDGKVEILDMNYSDELIKTELINKLSEIIVKEKHDTYEIYNCTFTFKKI